MDYVNYRIHRHISKLSTGHSGWQKELNLVAWGAKEPKYDIRCWNSSLPGKGITLSKGEAIILRDSLNALNMGE